MNRAGEPDSPGARATLPALTATAGCIDREFGMSAMRSSGGWAKRAGVAIGWTWASIAWSGPVADRIYEVSGHDIPPFTEAVIEALPAPAAGRDAPGACVDRPTVFASDADRKAAGWITRGYDQQLLVWAIAHYGARAGSRLQRPHCADGDFAIRAWQSALAEPETGRLTAAQGARLVQVVDRLDPRAARMKGLPPPAGTAPDAPRPTFDPRQASVARNASAGPATVADLLPRPAPLGPEDCARLNGEREPYYDALFARGLEGIHAAKRSYASPGWNAVAEDPEFVRWFERQVDASCYRIVKLEAWLRAIGSAAGVDDPAAVRDTRYVLGEARAAARGADRAK